MTTLDEYGIVQDLNNSIKEGAYEPPKPETNVGEKLVDYNKALVDGIRWLEGKFPDSYQLQLQFTADMLANKVVFIDKNIRVVVEEWLSQPRPTTFSRRKHVASPTK